MNIRTWQEKNQILEPDRCGTWQEKASPLEGVSYRAQRLGPETRRGGRKKGSKLPHSKKAQTQVHTTNLGHPGWV